MCIRDSSTTNVNMSLELFVWRVEDIAVLDAINAVMKLAIVSAVCDDWYVVFR